MKKTWLTAAFLMLAVSSLLAQDEEDKESTKKPFKEHLFTGGSIALGFSNNSFLVGGSPMLGYSLTKWADIGAVGNYNYTSYHDVSQSNDKLRQSVYGGGGFIKLYPVHFLFAQAQFEHNSVREKYLPPNGGTPESNTIGVNSFLVGAGYTTGRDPEFKRPFFYLSILFDVSGNEFSPYTSSDGNVIPVLKAGIQVPLFQGHKDKDRYYDR
ncbi:MAG: hypothetical protein ABI480_10175 [Chitinophagaceae bacterium]